MIDAKLVQQLLATARSVTPLTALRAASFDPGQHASEEAPIVRARVAARLPDGTFRVVVEGKPHRLALPPEIKPGDVVELRIATRASESAVSGRPGRVATETLSSAGQVLARALAQPASAPPRQSEPVLPLPPTGPEDLSEPLARAVERSGMFYESHQARWVEGGYPLQRLLQEPQAKLGRSDVPHAQSTPALPAGATAVNDPGGAAETSIVVSPAQYPITAAQGGEPSEQHALPGVVTGTPETEPSDTPMPGVPKDALPLVRQQLDTLEMRQLTWVGDIWPGQAMRWEIAEEPHDASSSAEADEQRWRSRFELFLPLLGNIGADIQLNGAQLRIRLTSQDQEAAAEMRSAAEELTLALRGCGLQVAACAIECHDSTD